VADKPAILSELFAVISGQDGAYRGAGNEVSKESHYLEPPAALLAKGTTTPALGATGAATGAAGVTGAGLPAALKRSAIAEPISGRLAREEVSKK
jgi:hypothetical protein